MAKSSASISAAARRAGRGSRNLSGPSRGRSGPGSKVTTRRGLANVYGTSPYPRAYRTPAMVPIPGTGSAASVPYAANRAVKLGYRTAKIGAPKGAGKA